jgi:hypothetical protein
VVQVYAHKIYDIPYVISAEAWRRKYLYCAGKSINIVKKANETIYYRRVLIRGLGHKVIEINV